MEKDAVIRKYQKSPAEDKRVRFTIGLANMEGLAVANRRASTHPVSILIWLGVSSLLVHSLDWWPKPEWGWAGYLQPLPMFACCVLPITFLMDWLNRPSFESLTQKVLLRPDINAVQSYYSRSASSGFWFLYYGPKFVGFIAIDASEDSLSDEPVTSKSIQEAKKMIKAKGTAHIATIRHFYVDELFRKTGIQEDLLSYAADHTFKSSKAVEKLRITRYSWAAYLDDALKGAGFEFVELGQEKYSVLRWRNSTFELTRATWETKRKGAKRE